ncbi:MAG: SpoIVB peptidase S55 domain-containing protein [Eubacteriales bacterium]|nr:SpoIVB peptidase S55 domain-containing protein [Eubacteriales bacterium]
MKRTAASIAFAMVLFLLLPLQARAATLLVPVGRVIGLQVLSDTVSVVAYDETFGGCARKAGLKIGDELLKINGTPIESPREVAGLLDGGPVELTVRRGRKETTLSLTPARTADGPRLGVYLRQGIGGIGTVTFYDPDTHLFGTLGHGVSDPRGNLLHMTGGSIFEAQIQSVKKGRSGSPGQLKGVAGDDRPWGTLVRNTPQGVFGICPGGWKGEPLPTADYAEIKQGPAAIRSTIGSGGVQEYSVEILKIYPETRPDSRNFLLKVTDPTLLETTGGIVQGMSGSPILQDGKLVGAVTHVLVNDPTTGYGIYIGNMLDAAA